MKETAALINSIRSPETLIVIISHDFEFLTLVADDILLMEKGTVISHTAFTKEKAKEVFHYFRAFAKNSGIDFFQMPHQQSR